MDEEDARERHNALAPAIVKTIFGAASSAEEVLVLLESIVAASVMIVTAPEHDGKILNALMKGIRERLVELREEITER